MSKFASSIVPHCSTQAGSAASRLWPAAYCDVAKRGWWYLLMCRTHPSCSPTPWHPTKCCIMAMPASPPHLCLPSPPSRAVASACWRHQNGRPGGWRRASAMLLIGPSGRQTWSCIQKPGNSAYRHTRQSGNRPAKQPDSLTGAGLRRSRLHFHCGRRRGGPPLAASSSGGMAAEPVPAAGACQLTPPPPLLLLHPKQTEMIEFYSICSRNLILRLHSIITPACYQVKSRRTLLPPPHARPSAAIQSRLSGS